MYVVYHVLKQWEGGYDDIVVPGKKFLLFDVLGKAVVATALRQNPSLNVSRLGWFCLTSLLFNL